MRLAAITVTLLALTLAACGGGDDADTATAPDTAADTAATTPADTAAEPGGAYPEQARQNFLNACEQGGSPEQCECALKALEKKIPFEDFAKADAEVAEGGELPSDIQRAIEGCR